MLFKSIFVRWMSFVIIFWCRKIPTVRFLSIISIFLLLGFKMGFLSKILIFQKHFIFFLNFCCIFLVPLPGNLAWSQFCSIHCTNSIASFLLQIFCLISSVELHSTFILWSSIRSDTTEKAKTILDKNL